MPRRETDSPNWGGRRPGAGRQCIGRTPRMLRATGQEWMLIKSFAKTVRELERGLVIRLVSEDSAVRNQAYLDWAESINENLDGKIPTAVMRECLEKMAGTLPGKA